MTRPLVRVGAEDVPGLLRALSRALEGSGPAVLPGAEPPLEPALPSALAPMPEAVDDRIALVIETSGSTGRPKRVALSASASAASTAASDVALGGAGQWLLALPAHYIAGVNVLVRSLAAGTSPSLLPAGPFGPAGFVTAARRMTGTRRFVSLVPVQLSRLFDAAEASGDRTYSDAEGAAPADVREALLAFDRVLVGGQSVPPLLLDRARRLGVAITRTYGSSETSGGCVYDGRPLAGVGMRVRHGQVELSGPVLAEGYLDDPDRTAAAFIEEAGERWYRTGDAGELEGGSLHVTGRLDRVIISGGVNVSLDELERVVQALSGSEVVAVPRESAEWGEVAVLVSERSLVLDDVRAQVVPVLGRAAAPAAVVHVDRMPRLANGKPDLLALRRFAAERATWPPHRPR